MTDGIALPPARERNRYGVKTLERDAPATAADALLDRVLLRVRGTITPLDQDALRRFVGRVGSPNAGTLFNRASREKGRWVAKAQSGTTIFPAKLAMWSAGELGHFELTFSVNPIRTLGHLLDDHPYSDIAALSPAAFFAARATPSATSRTLDGQDNMVADYRAFSGTFQATRLQRVAEYLATFEAKLVGYLMEQLCPAHLGFMHAELEGCWIGESDEIIVQLDWGGLTVSQSEACWEWHEPDALAKAHALADGAFAAARSATVNFFDRPTVERKLGAVSVRLPLPSGVALVVYAKAIDRLRLEVRYKSGLPDMVRDRLPPIPRRLTDWFDAIRAHAAERVPWDNLHDLMVPPATTSLDLMADLLVAVAEATDRARSKRRSLLRLLLRHGTATATGPDGMAPRAVLERLVRSGTLEHVRLVSRDPERGRRYRLTRQYAGLVPHSGGLYP